MARRVLIAEDDPAIQTIVAEYLLGEGFDVDVANNGAEALELARQTPPDVAIVDMFMPIMDGQHLLAAWRRDGALKGVPIIVVSAAANLGDVAARYNVVATLTKPFDLDELAALIQHSLQDPRPPPGAPDR